jgi:hypothetical protein
MSETGTCRLDRQVGHEDGAAIAPLTDAIGRGGVEPARLIDLHMILPHQQTHHGVGKEILEMRINEAGIGRPRFDGLHHGRAPFGSRIANALEPIGRFTRQLIYTPNVTFRIHLLRVFSHMLRRSKSGAITSFTMTNTQTLVAND